MKVRATKKYEELKVDDAELKRRPKVGEEFEVSKERFNILNGNNSYKAIFVEKVEEIETAVKKEKTEKAVKKQPRKLNNYDI